MSGRLEGRVALVTGAASGIGRAAARALAREGARLGLADLDATGGEVLAQEIRAAGGQARFVPTDVSRAEEVRRLVEAVVGSYGGLDCAFNNAGIEGRLAPLAELSLEDFDRVMDVNLRGVFLCLREEIPHLVARGGGAIVNTASVAGLVGAGGFGAYVASKHAVVGLTRCVALDYAASGIRANAICPGVIQTSMLDRIGVQVPGATEALAATIPLGRLGTAEEIGRAVAWLCSDEASYVTGVPFPVDGGYVAH